MNGYVSLIVFTNIHLYSNNLYTLELFVSTSVTQIVKI